MKIVKEVAIKASVADTWSWLTENKMLSGLHNLKGDGDIRRRSGSQRRSPEGQQRTEPQRKITFASEIAPSIITTLELFEQGRRTGLKVTIGGWETVDPDVAKIEMPKVSLSWEKNLSLIKKSIELVSQKPIGAK